MNIWAYRRAYGEWGYLVAQGGTMKQKKGHDMETGMIQGYSTSTTFFFEASRPLASFADAVELVLQRCFGTALWKVGFHNDGPSGGPGTMV